MRPPAQVWEAFAQDERWVDNQAAVVAEIMREAYAAGFAAGAGLTGRAVDDHVASIARNLSMRVPPAVPNGLRVIAQRVLEIGADQAVVRRAWDETLATGGRAKVAQMTAPSFTPSGPESAPA